MIGVTSMRIGRSPEKAVEILRFKHPKQTLGAKLAAEYENQKHKVPSSCSKLPNPETLNSGSGGALHMQRNGESGKILGSWR